MTENKRIYGVYENGIYRGQIIRIKSISQLEKILIDGDIKINKVVSVDDSINQMITKE